MTAQSVLGIGHGDSNKYTTKELSTLATGPCIIFTGISESVESLAVSPPANTATITFPYALPGGANAYIVLLTSLNAGFVYVSDRDEDADENFTGFSFISETEGEVMYLVARVGFKPNYLNQ